MNTPTSKKYDFAFENENVIAGFFGKYRFLSNFENLTKYGTHDFLGKDRFPTSEHCYKYCKKYKVSPIFTIAHFHNPELISFFKQKPSEILSFGSNNQDNIVWLNYLRNRTMYQILSVKFEIPEMRYALLETGKKTLIELNNWGGVHWGVTLDGVGKNTLGRLLMIVREKITTEDQNQPNLDNYLKQEVDYGPLVGTTPIQQILPQE